MKEQTELQARLAKEAADSQRRHELVMQQAKDTNEEEWRALQREIADARAEDKKNVPRHKRNQGLFKFYSLGNDIGSWLKNLESILYDENILEESSVRTSAVSHWKSLNQCLLNN